jgi:CubicO group peptidase (beta-lactamase class C family)
MSNQVDTKGFCSDEYAPIRDAFETNFTEGLDIGASLHLTLEGETIVDLWGGHADNEAIPWNQDTIACVYSATKIPTIICTLLVIDRGLLVLDEPVATYWPEFAQGGKEKVTVRQALTHRALVPGLKDPLPPMAVTDWDQIISRIAAESVWFDTDTICYHAYTFGYILGELIQRVSGKPFQQFFYEELANPLAADFLMGLGSEEDLSRVARLLNAESFPHEKGSIPEQVFDIFSTPIEDDFFQSWVAQSSIGPSGMGFTNAAGLCKFATMLANKGEINGRSFLSPEIIQEASSLQFHGVCPMLGEINLGLGFGLDGTGFPAPTPESFHWGGYGGSWCFMDTSRALAGAYVMKNCYVPDDWGDFNDPRMARFVDTIRTLFVN